MNNKLKLTILFFLCATFLTGCGAILKMKTRKAIETINSGNIEAYLKDWSEDAVFIYPGNSSGSGIIKGKENIKTWFENWKKVFPDLKFTVKGIYLQKSIYIGSKNVIAVHWEVSGTNKLGKKVNSSGIGVVTIEGTKITKAQDYIFDAHKLKEFWGE